MMFAKSCRTVGVRAGLLTVVLAAFSARVATAQGVIPGSGVRVTDVGDNFEDAKWTFVSQNPKSSNNIDFQNRYPIGQSTNGHWLESAKRGHPDVVMRIDTPDGGLSGSTGALFLQTKESGIPGRPSMKQHQDDLVMHFSSSIGGAIPVSWSPSMVVRVCMPPFEKWEQRTGASFGWRASVTGFGPLEEEDSPEHRKPNWFTGRVKPLGSGVDNFYPGIFIQFNSKKTTGKEKDSASFIIRGNSFRQDFQGPEITEPGWWTLGMSFTPDGRVHYYASPGVDDLTAADHIASHFSQGVTCHRVNTMFFNVVSMDDGRTWSTPWVIDDPAFYTMNSAALAVQPGAVRR
ncbi:MAG: hypothetical protein WD648_06955 [Planctomycetaceae bacterium]